MPDDSGIDRIILKERTDMIKLIAFIGWEPGMGWGIALALAFLVVAVGIYAKLRKR